MGTPGANAGFIHEWATWYDAGLILAGVGAGLLGAKADVYEPPLFASVALLSARAGYEVMAKTATTTSTGAGAVRRVATPAAAGIPAPAYGQWFHPGRKTQGATLVG
jgi:hypothetical protein